MYTDILYVRYFYFMCVCVQSSMRLTSWFCRFGLWARPPIYVIGVSLKGVTRDWLNHAFHLTSSKLNQELRRYSSSLLSGKSLSSHMTLSFYTAINFALKLYICYWPRKTTRIFIFWRYVALFFFFYCFLKNPNIRVGFSTRPCTVCDWSSFFVYVLWLDNSADCLNIMSDCRNWMTLTGWKP